MAESRLIQKQLAGKEDLLLGIGTVKQGRASGIKTITKLNATHFGGVLVVDTINDLNSLDKNQLDEQVVFVKETGATYSYNGTSWVVKITIATVENIEDLATYTGSDTVIVKDINRGGTFVSKTEVDIDPNTGSVYTVNGGTVFAKLGGGFWVRQFSGAVNVKWFGAKGDGVTDDTLAIQNALNIFGYIADTNYPTKRRSIVFPNGVYKVTSINVLKYTDVLFDGAILKPFNPLQTLDYLIAFYGFSTITNLVIDMDYSISYGCAVYTRGRYNTFNVPIVWRAKLAYIVGDPAWENPLLSHLGDSENIWNGGECNWCLNVMEAYGINTLIHLTGGIKLYSYKWTMDECDSRKSDWEARPEWIIKNHGTMIYISNAFIGNFSSAVSCIIAKFQEANTIALPEYINTYGAVILNNTHIETGAFFSCENVPGKNAYTSDTYILNMSGCHGYVSGGNSGYYIDLSALSSQKASINKCNFYGNTVSLRAIYAYHVIVDYDISSFNGATKTAFLIRKIFNKSNALLLSANSSGQSLSTMTNLVFSNFNQADYSNSFLGSWYNSSVGEFIADTDLYNVELDLSLDLNGEPVTGTDIQVYVNNYIPNGMVYASIDKIIKCTFNIPFVEKGQVITVKARSHDNLSLSTTSLNNLRITANV